MLEMYTVLSAVIMSRKYNSICTYLVPTSSLVLKRTKIYDFVKKSLITDEAFHTPAVLC